MEQRHDTVNNLINTFLKPPPGKSPEAIKERLLHWTEMANSPELYAGDKPVADIRRKARQNLKRTIQQYPEVAAQLAREMTAPSEGA